MKTPWLGSDSNENALRHARLGVHAALLAALALSGCFTQSDIPVVDASVDADVDGTVDADVDASVPPPPPFAVGTHIRQVTADDQRIYWVEYGTHDALGNYLDDGALRAKPLLGGDTQTIATGLSGPVEVGVTSTHAYVFLDAQIQSDGTRGVAFVRLPLAGGAVQPVQQGVWPCYQSTGHLPLLAADADRAYWSLYSLTVPAGGASYTYAASPTYTMAASDTAPSVFLSDPSRNAFFPIVDGTYLYFSDDAVYRVPLAGGTPELFASLNVQSSFAVHQGRILSLDWDYSTADTYLLETEPGTVPRRLASLGNAASGGLGWSSQLVLANGWYMAGLDHLDGGSVSATFFVAGPLTNPTDNRILGTTNVLPVSWVGTSVGVFWTDGSQIVLAPL